MLPQGKLVSRLDYTDDPQTPDVSTIRISDLNQKGYVALCQSRDSLLSSKTDIIMISGLARLFHEMADLVYFPPLTIKRTPNP